MYFSHHNEESCDKEEKGRQSPVTSSPFIPGFPREDASFFGLGQATMGQAMRWLGHGHNTQRLRTGIPHVFSILKFSLYSNVKNIPYRSHSIFVLDFMAVGYTLNLILCDALVFLL